MILAQLSEHLIFAAQLIRYGRSDSVY